MNPSLLLLGLWLFALAFAIMMFFRNNAVLTLRTKLLNEEHEFTGPHTMEIPSGDWWRREKSLPSYDRMFFTFWRTVGSFGERVGKIEDWYPEIKEKING